MTFQFLQRLTLPAVRKWYDPGAFFTFVFNVLKVKGIGGPAACAAAGSKGRTCLDLSIAPQVLYEAELVLCKHRQSCPVPRHSSEVRRQSCLVHRQSCPHVWCTQSSAMHANPVQCTASPLQRTTSPVYCQSSPAQCAASPAWYNQSSAMHASPVLWEDGKTWFSTKRTPALDWTWWVQPVGGKPVSADVPTAILPVGALILICQNLYLAKNGFSPTGLACALLYKHVRASRRKRFIMHPFVVWTPGRKHHSRIYEGMLVLLG